MTVAVWRIASDAPDWEATDLGGRGAERTGGRWNRRGTPVLYASSSIALACLETVVHLNAGLGLPLNRYLVRIDLPDEIWARRTAFDAGQIGWDAEPPGRVSLNWGQEWLLSARTLLAEVPSVVVPEERNLLINPAHADATRLRATKLRKWLYDGRLR